MSAPNLQRRRGWTSLPPMPDTPPDPLAALASLEGVGSAMAATRDGIDAMLRDRGLRRTTADLTGESLLRGAHASAVLEGSASSLEEAREGTGDEVTTAALRVSTGLLALLPVLEHSPLQVLARLHTAAGSHLIRVPLATLEEQWQGAGFVRIHRSILVALGHVTEIRMESGRCTVAVGPRGASTDLVVSRRHTRELREMLGRRA